MNFNVDTRITQINNAQRSSISSKAISTPIDRVLSLGTMPNSSSASLHCRQLRHSIKQVRTSNSLSLSCLLLRSLLTPSASLNMIWPPSLVQPCLPTWQEIFGLICRPELLFNVWKPNKSLDKLTIIEVWNCYVFGVRRADGRLKPPLRSVEQEFQARWRSSEKVWLLRIIYHYNINYCIGTTIWGCFREIPEWIDGQSKIKAVSPRVVISELETIRYHSGSQFPLGLNQLSKQVKQLRVQTKQAHLESGSGLLQASSRLQNMVRSSISFSSLLC